MADSLQRVGLVFKADGAVDFRKSLTEVNNAVQENRNSFKLAKIQWNENTTAMEKLEAQQEYLAKQTVAYTQKIDVLDKELKDLENAEKRNEQAIKKKKNQLDNAKLTLASYEKGLKEVTAQITSGSAEMEEEMKKLDGSLNTLSEAAKENQSAFGLVKTEWEEGTKKAKKLKDEQSFLVSQTQNYEKQVETLEKQLSLLENAEERNEKAISAKKSQLSQTKAELNKYKKSLNDVEEELENGAAKIKEYSNKLGEFGNKAKDVSSKLSGVSKGAAGLAAGAAALVPATEEYRKIMASLEASSELAGYSAEETEKTYEQLFGVLGDEQTAATTTANLQALGLEQSQLTELVNGTIGAWAKYGDSIPIDGLAESINETIRAGQVTGTFADVLNWGSMEGETFGVKMKENTKANEEWNKAVESATTAEDFFNLALQEAGSNTERLNLVQQLLAEQGLTQTGEKWQETNKNIVESNKATADFEQETAQLADTIAPVIAELTEVAAELLGKFNALPEETQRNIAAFILFIAAVAPIIGIIGDTSSGISGLIGLLVKGGPSIVDVFKTVGDGAKDLWAIMAANPVGAIITVIGLLIGAFVTAYNKCEWFRNGVDKFFKDAADFFKGLGKDFKETGEDILEFFKGLGKGIGDFFSFKWLDIKLPHLKISGDFSLAPPRVPKLSVKWYAKGGILNRPTLFGQNGGELMGGGEAGPEAVLPIRLLKEYIREENNLNNKNLVSAFIEALKTLDISPDVNVYIGDGKLTKVLANEVTKIIGNGQKERMRAMGLA